MKEIYIGESKYKLIRTKNGLRIIKLDRQTEKGGETDA